MSEQKVQYGDFHLFATENDAFVVGGWGAVQDV
jgi:hypothetical protein